MTITLPLTPFMTLLIEHPWAAITLVFLLSVVLPAVWIPFCRAAAFNVLRLVLDAVVKIAIAVRGAPLPLESNRPNGR